MDELACFAPGMLALGSFGYEPDKAGKFLSLAEEVIFCIEYAIFFFPSTMGGLLEHNDKILDSVSSGETEHITAATCPKRSQYKIKYMFSKYKLN